VVDSTRREGSKIRRNRTREGQAIMDWYGKLLACVLEALPADERAAFDKWDQGGPRTWAHRSGLASASTFRRVRGPKQERRNEERV